MTPLLRVNLTRRFLAGPVIELAFEQPADQFSVTVLFGPSGCGKTTTLRCLAGLDRPQQGRITLGDAVWFDAAANVFVAPQRRMVGHLSQDYALFPHLTVAQNIAFGLGALPRTEQRRIVGKMIERFRLQGLERRYPVQTSGGQQQRVALARALARRPGLLLLDEPLSALDEPTRDELRQELRRLLTDFAVPVVLVTHVRTEAIALADQVVIMDQGRVCQIGPALEVFTRPRTMTTARVVGVETLLACRVLRIEAGLAIVTVGSVQLVCRAGEIAVGKATLCIRAEEVLLQGGCPAGAPASDRLECRVQTVIPEGPLVRVLLDAGFALTALVPRPAWEEMGLHEGDTVIAALRPSALHLVPGG
jgi:molybdate transport system ATP-binding protein